MVKQIKSSLAEDKERLRKKFLAGGDVDTLLADHAKLVDGLMAALYEAAAGKPLSSFAVVAVGGYGRSELFPHSDIDLLFLHDDKGAQAGKVAKQMLYGLWDLGLKVGQSHRSVEEALTLAENDITIRTNLLDARFIAGNKALFEGFCTQFKNAMAKDGAAQFIEAKLVERDRRHRKFGDSRYMLEPNVKEGKGGLRDVHTLWWLARYCYGISDFKELPAQKLLTKEEFTQFDQARRFLSAVRAHLHYQAGHAEERLTFDRQQAMAEAMGFKHPSANRAIERFMRRYFVAVRTIGASTRIFCALLEDEKIRKPKKPMAWLWQAPWKLGKFTLDGERISLKNAKAFEQQPILMLELFRLGQQHGLDIHPRALQLVTRNLKRIDDKLQRSAKANTLLLEMLLSSKEAEATLRRMSDAGVLGKFIPDFGRVVGQTQFNMYHVYTVDEHTLVAIGILHAIVAGRLREDVPLASEVAGRISSRHVLFLALFCHDIAKGRGGDHSELGEKIAMKLARRMGFSKEDAATAAWLVRYHLLLSSTALKRDIEDPKTIEDFVTLVQSPERLKLLFVLTIADIRAVAPTVWNSWKASLLDELYRRAEQAMGAGEAAFRKHQTEQLTNDILAHLPGWDEEDVVGYFSLTSPGYLSGLTAAQHATVMRMLKQARDTELSPIVNTDHDYERKVSEIIVVTPDTRGLFSNIAGAMALSGANIINAKIFTLKDGMAVDIFQVQDAAGDVFDRPDRLAKLSVYIKQALFDGLDLRKALKTRSSGANPSRNAIKVAGQVFIENEASNVATVIEISGHDRSGFLYDVTSAISELGLTIITAHISTYGTQVADVFYVKDLFGMKITHENKIRQIQEALLEAIRGK